MDGSPSGIRAKYVAWGHSAFPLKQAEYTLKVELVDPDMRIFPSTSIGTEEDFVKSVAVPILVAAVLLGGWAQPSLGQNAFDFKANVNLAVKSSGPENDLYDFVVRELADVPGVKLVEEKENYVINIFVIPIENDDADDKRFAIHYAAYSPYNSELPELLVNSMLETKLEEEIPGEFWNLFRNINSDLYRILLSRLLISDDLREAARTMVKSIDTEVFGPSRAIYAKSDD